MKPSEVCEAIHSVSPSASESESLFACLVAAMRFVYSASDDHLAFALVTKAHIAAWRCEASYLHAALLVL